MGAKWERSELRMEPVVDETGNGLDESEEYEAEHNTKETEIEEKPYEPPTLMLASDLHLYEQHHPR